MLFWLYCVPFIIVYGVLVALRTRWNRTLATVVPALAASALVAIGWVSLISLEGQFYLEPGPALAALMFFATFGVYFMAIGSVVMITGFIAARVRKRGNLSESDKPSD